MEAFILVGLLLSAKWAANQNQSAIDGALHDELSSMVHQQGELLLSYITRFTNLIDCFATTSIEKSSAEAGCLFCRCVHSSLNYLKCSIKSAGY